MGRLHNFSLLIFAVGVLLFPFILLSAFFIPYYAVSLMLSTDALLVSLANLYLNHSWKKKKERLEP